MSYNGQWKTNTQDNGRFEKANSAFSWEHIALYAISFIVGFVGCFLLTNGVGV